MSARRGVIVIALGGVICATILFSRPATATPAVVSDQYIVVFRDTISDPIGKAGALATQHGLILRQRYRHALQGFAAVVPPAQLARLQGDPDVAYVVPDQLVTIAAQYLPTGVRRIGAEYSPTAKIDSWDERVDVDVAVLDTGIDRDHPDLNVVGGTNCAPGRGDKDGHGHGTHVAGTIAAKDNDSGVVGVAPGARLWAVRVLDNTGDGTISDIVCGIDWVIAHADTIEVANLSLRMEGRDDDKCGRRNRDPLHRAICRGVAKGVTFVAAAGNNAANTRDSVPAAYDEVITVSALADFDGQPGAYAHPSCRYDEDDTFASFSNYGPAVDLIAPGVCITSTWPGGGYEVMSGTSMATAHVSGAAALYKARHLSASPSQVERVLREVGTTAWNNHDDGDHTKEPLLNIKDF
jgi:subtilisin